MRTRLYIPSVVLLVALFAGNSTAQSCGGGCAGGGGGGAGGKAMFDPTKNQQVNTFAHRDIARRETNIRLRR